MPLDILEACDRDFRSRAGVAQLVEYKLPKLGVAGSIPVARSKLSVPATGRAFFGVALEGGSGHLFVWRGGKDAAHGSPAREAARDDHDGYDETHPHP